MTATDSRTVGRRVLLAVDHGPNRELLERWIDADATLAVAPAEGDGADLVVFDGPAFARRRAWLRETRAAVAPAYLPCLLTTPHGRVSMLTAEIWRDVDELITTPIRPEELRVRVERLLALRGRSLELAGSLADLGRSNTDLQEFAYVAAHELSTPLSVVTGVIETVTGRYADSLPVEVRSLLAAATSSSERLQHTIDDLLAYSRVGRADSLGPVALADVLREALVPFAPQLEASGAEIHAGPLPVVLGDAAQLRLVLGNLVGNAVKYRSPGVTPLIRIEAAPVDTGWCVSIDDNGIGIDAERAHAVFEMFERAEPGRDRPGSGIGLALCKRIVERHGGRIWIDRSASGGTRVSFTLPAA